MKVVTYFPLFLFFISQSVPALDPGIIRQVCDINKQKLIGVKEDCRLSLVTPFELSKPSQNPEYNDCAVALCGVPADNPSAWLTDANFSQNVPEKLKKEVEKLTPTFNAIYERAKKKNLEELANLKKIVNDTAIEKIDPKKFSSSFREDIDGLVFKPYLQDVIDYSKPFDKRYSVQINLPPNATSAFKAAIGDYAAKYKSYVENDYYYFSEKGLYKKEELYDFAKIQLAQVENFIKQNEKNVSQEDFKSSRNYLLEARKQFEDADASNFNSDIFFSNLNLSQLVLLTNNPEITSVASQPRCISEQCRLAYFEYIKSQNLTKSLEKLNAGLNDPLNKTRSINRCKARLITNVMKETDRKKALTVFANAKQAIEKNVLPRFSAHSRRVLQDYLNTKLTANPMNLVNSFKETNALDQFRQNAKNYDTDELPSSFISMASAEESAQNELESSIKKSITINSSIADIDPFSDFASPCSQGVGSNAWDSFLPVKVLKEQGSFPDQLKSIGDNDQIFVSDFSCSNEHRGKHAVAHEIGHALNTVFAREKLSTESAKLYKSLRGCATENYIDAQKAMTFYTQEGDSIYSEEDSADLFAFMSYPEDKQLFTCSLLKPSFDTDRYTDLDFILNEGDSHSTSFARVIVEAINKNVTLPVSCQRIISKDRPKMSLKKCI